MPSLKTGPFEDRRREWSVYVTGHPDAIPLGHWAFTPAGRREFMHPGAAEVRSYLDAVLWRRREADRVQVWCRGNGGLGTGIDRTVRAYCEVRGISCLPVATAADQWGDDSGFRRDLEAVARSHAVVWFGPRQERDPVTLAMWLGIPYRVAELPAAVALEEA